MLPIQAIGIPMVWCTVKHSMGWYQRGVHFGAASLKRGKESSKFPVAIFCLPFILHYF